MFNRTANHALFKRAPLNGHTSSEERFASSFVREREIQLLGETDLEATLFKGGSLSERLLKEYKFKIEYQLFGRRSRGHFWLN